METSRHGRNGSGRQWWRNRIWTLRGPQAAIALNKCIESGGDAAKEVAYRVRNLKLERGKDNDFVLGPEFPP